MGYFVIAIVGIFVIFGSISNKARKKAAKTHQTAQESKGQITTSIPNWTYDEDDYIYEHEYSGRNLPLSYTVIDTETTGLHSNDRIVELAAVRVRNGAIESSYHKLINPGMPINPMASQVNGITDSMVKHSPSFRLVKDDFLSFIGNDILVGHNIPFDIKFINRELGYPITNRFVDTLKLARSCVCDTANYKLATLVKYFGLDKEQDHRALGDAELTFQVYEKLKEIDQERKLKEEAQMMSLQSVVELLQNSSAVLTQYDKAIVDYLTKKLKYKKNIAEQVPAVQSNVIGSIHFLYIQKQTINEEQFKRLLSIAERHQNEIDKRMAVVARIDIKSRTIQEPRTDWQRRTRDMQLESRLMSMVETAAASDTQAV